MSGLQTTFSPKASEINKKWYIVDAEGKILGRLATRLSDILRGKHKPGYTPHLDDGDNIIVINAEKIVLTGNKGEDKEYFHHTKYVGSETFTNIKKYMKAKPEYILDRAIWGMMPKTKLGHKIFKNLKIYRGSDHPHTAQKPEKLEI